MKKAFFVLITITIIVVITAIFGEIGFRIKDLFDKNRGLKNSMGHVNKKYCHGFKPNTRFRLTDSKYNEYDVEVAINNFRFRGKDITEEKIPGVTRIMAIGDSFTFGVGAEEDETVPFLIEKGLLEEGKKAEVINAGVGNYSPLLHYLRLKDEYFKFKPDLVLYFFDFSDLADDWRLERNLVYDKAGNIIRCDPAYLDGKRDWWKTLRIHSKLCVYIHNKIVRLVGKIRILGFKNYVKAKLEGKRAKSLIVQSDGKNVNSIEYDAYLMIRGPEKLPEIEKHFMRNEKYLTLIKDTLAKNGIPMILVIYPYGIHVGTEQWKEGRAYWGFEEDVVYDDYYAFELLENWAAKNNAPCINTLPDFLDNAEKNLFFNIDGHFTPEANGIVAQAVLKNDDFNSVLDEL